MHTDEEIKDIIKKRFEVNGISTEDSDVLEVNILLHASTQNVENLTRLLKLLKTMRDMEGCKDTNTRERYDSLEMDTLDFARKTVKYVELQGFYRLIIDKYLWRDGEEPCRDINKAIDYCKMWIKDLTVILGERASVDYNVEFIK